MGDELADDQVGAGVAEREVRARAGHRQARAPAQEAPQLGGVRIQAEVAGASRPEAGVESRPAADVEDQGAGRKLGHQPPQAGVYQSGTEHPLDGVVDRRVLEGSG